MKKNERFSLRMMSLLTVLMLAWLTAACGSAAPSGQSGEAAPAAPQAAKTDSGDSGKLVIYTAGPKNLSEAIKQGFEAKTGIVIEQFEGTTGKVLARLEAEKSNPVADIVILASWPSAMGMKSAGWTQSYKEADGADKLYKEWMDPDYHFFGYSASALGITYNTKLVQEPPKDWSDFTAPEWKGAVTIPDPSLSGSALDFIAGYLNDKGEDSWSLFEQLQANGVEMAGANKEALDPVITGAKSAVLAGVDYMAYSAKAKGEPVEMVYPASGTVINVRPALILKDAPHADNAKRFIDYLLSNEAQNLVADAYLLPGRQDIPAKDRAGVADIPVLNIDWDWMNANSDAISARFLDLYKP